MQMQKYLLKRVSFYRFFACDSIYAKRAYVIAIPSLQLGTGKTAAVRLVGKSCLSVRLSLATFGHISGTGRPINFVFGMRQRAARECAVRARPACVSTPEEATHARRGATAPSV